MNLAEFADMLDRLPEDWTVRKLGVTVRAFISVFGDVKVSTKDPDRCSFCSKPRDEVMQLVTGPGNVRICDLCTDIATEVVREARETKRKEKKRANR